TQEEQYTELLEPIPESHQVPHNNNDVISEDVDELNPNAMVDGHVFVNPFANSSTSAAASSSSQNNKHDEEQTVIKNRSRLVMRGYRQEEGIDFEESFTLDIMSVVQKESIVDTSDLQPELECTKERFENCIIKKENEYAKLWNDWYKKCDECKYDKISYDKAYKDMQQKIERLQAQLGDLKGKPPMLGDIHALSKPVTSNSILTPQEAKVMKTDKNVISKVVCAMCKQCLISVNHNVCLRNYVNGKTSRGTKQKANVSIKEKQKKHQLKVKKTKKVGFSERIATPKPSKPRFSLRWSPTGRLFDLKGKIIAFSESESQSDCSNGDNACTSNTMEPKINRFPNSTSLLGRLSKFVYGVSTRVVPSI
nr:hypothetical protein [Tanacetum cinerariifolium]